MLRPPRAPSLALLVSLTALLACGPAFDAGSGANGGAGGQDTTTSSTGPGGGEGGDFTASAVSAGSGGSGGVAPSGSSVGSGGSGGCDSPVSETFAVHADTTITSADVCVSTGDLGADPVLRLGSVGEDNATVERVGLVRFEVSAGAADALNAGAVLELMLLGTVADECTEGDVKCVPTDGTLQVRRLRNDWLERADAPFGSFSGLGANWCRRFGAQPWQALGAKGATEDTGAAGGSAALKTTGEPFEVAIDLEKLAPWVSTVSAKSFVSLRLNAIGAVRLAIASQEHPSLDASRLRVKYCPAAR